MQIIIASFGYFFTCLALISCASNAPINSKITPPADRHILNVIESILDATNGAFSIASLEDIGLNKFVREGLRFTSSLSISSEMELQFLYVPRDNMVVHFNIESRMLSADKFKTLVWSNETIERNAAIMRPYFENVIQKNCISKKQIFDTLSNRGWQYFSTNLSSKENDNEGNFLFEKSAVGYTVVTIDKRCLAQTNITTGRAYLGEYGSRLK